MKVINNSSRVDLSIAKGIQNVAFESTIVCKMPRKHLLLSEVLGQIKVVAWVLVNLSDPFEIPTTQPKFAQPFKSYVEV